jgi:hypothetical protein
MTAASRDPAFGLWIVGRAAHTVWTSGRETRYGPNQGVSDEDGEPMSDQPESPSPDTDAPVEGDGDGIEITTSEPNTFEPEEDPDAAEA